MSRRDGQSGRKGRRSGTDEPRRDRRARSDREPRRSAETLVPGVRAVEALLEHQPQRIRLIRYAGAREGARARVLDRAEALGIELRETSDKVLDEKLGELRHQGLVATVQPADYRPWAELLETPDALLLAFDQVTDPRNLGAMLRAAEAMRATGALIMSNRSARLGPTVTRTSAGASELLPVAMETNLARSLRSARDAGLQIVGADLDGDPPSALDLTRPTVLVIGAEGRGLRRLTRECCDAIATIPLGGLTESLNAATAAAVLVYEATRQRRAVALAEKKPEMS